MADNFEGNEDNLRARFNISVNESATHSADSSKEADVSEKVVDSDPEPTKSEDEEPKKGLKVRMRNRRRAREKPHRETSRKRGKRERNHLLLPLHPHPPLQVPQTLIQRRNNNHIGLL